MSLYEETIATLGRTGPCGPVPRSVSFSCGEHAAKPWAKLAQPSWVRAGRCDAAAATLSRYADRVAALRRAMRSVTAATVGWVVCSFTLAAPHASFRGSN